MGVGGSIGAGGATIGGGGMLRMYDILYTLSQFINNCLPCHICFCFSVGIGVQPVIRRQSFFSPDLHYCSFRFVNPFTLKIYKKKQEKLCSVKKETTRYIFLFFC